MTAKKILCATIIIVCSMNCFAQQQKQNAIANLYSINNVGLIEGEAGSAFQLETINGLKYKSWFAGVGLGLDFYRIRTVPLFAHIRKEFGKTVNRFFLFGDAGIDFGWRTDKETKQFPVNDKLKNGFYAQAGAGYTFRLSPVNNLSFSLGYSYKTLTEFGSNYTYIGYGAEAMPVKDSKISYHLNRFVIKAGFEF